MLAKSQQELVARILATYNVTYSSISHPQKGYRNASYAVLRNDQKPLNVILYKHEAGIVTRIKNANAVGDFMAKNGLPTRKSYSPKILALTSPTRTRYAALYEYLPGKTIPWEAYTMEHIKMLGKMMSDMHAALASFNKTDLPDVAAENLALNRRMLRYFADAHVAKALQAKLGLTVSRADFTKLLRACQKLPRQQALHMDFVRGNILFEGTDISGILDFEKSARGNAVFDVARTLAFLIVDCKYKDEPKIRKYFLQSGYIKRGSANFKNVKIGGTDVLEELITFFLLHDFYKFLRHNPYESLPANEHFTRTKTMLLKRMILMVPRVE